MSRQIQDLIVLKDGTSINGVVDIVTFELRTRYGTLTLRKSDILSIEYAKPPITAQDEVQTSAGGRLAGDLQPSPVPIVVESTGTRVEIAKEDVLALVFFTGQWKVSDNTRKALAR